MTVKQPEGQSVDVVLRTIRSEILTGRLAPGRTVPQAALAHELSVSRTPMREALRMLHQEGLVDLPPNRRPRVAALSATDLENLYVVRMPLESAAIALTIPRLGPEDVATLEGLRAQMEHFADEHDADRWEVPHGSFQALLVSKSGARSRALLKELSDHSERYRRLMTRREPATWAALKHDHNELLAAVKARDAAGAAALRLSHFMRTVAGVMAVLEPLHDYTVLEELHDQLTGEARTTPRITQKEHVTS